MVNREKMTRNFVERYGPERLDRLLDALSAGESGEAIAREFEVSRERVRQWKNAFGQLVTIYQVHPEVRRVAAASAAPADQGRLSGTKAPSRTR